MLSRLKREIKDLADTKQAEILQKFFKTAKAQYGEGDVFLGIKVPLQRKIAKKYKELSRDQIQSLLNSKIHEERLISLLILIEQFCESDEKQKKTIFNFYLKNTANINNWDLVDLTAGKIIGDFLIDKPKKILYKLAGSENLWERRISIVATHRFIRENKLKEAIEISEILLKDKHNLIHKAVGWTLREVGKKDQELLEEFIKKNYAIMSRTTLRYAIEKFSQTKRKKYLNMI